MKKRFLVLLALLFIIKTYSQISFEKGYFINNSNEKIECLIKNIDWKNNPTKFKYKFLNDNTEQKITIKSVKSFEIYNQSRYERHSINIDKSSNEIKDLTIFKNPKYIEETLFLKVLLQGKANLYKLEEGNITKFFYNTENSKITQLIFKRYLNKDNKVANNNSFKQQLWNNLKCEKISSKSIKKLNYKKNDLVNLFEKYNECFSSKFENFEKRQKRDLFNLTLRPGINLTSASIENTGSSYKNTNFSDEIGLRFGIELELIMPFNKNKWSILLEPTYHYYKSEKETTRTTSSITQNTVIDFKSIELPFGVRHYIFLNDKSKLFIDASLVFDLITNSEVDFGNYNELEIKTRNNFTFGAGFKYKDKHSIQLKYSASKDLFANYLYWKSTYTSMSLIYGYTIF